MEGAVERRGRCGRARGAASHPRLRCGVAEEERAQGDAVEHPHPFTLTTGFLSPGAGAPTRKESGFTVPRDARRASPATTRMREGRMCRNSSRLFATWSSRARTASVEVGSAFGHGRPGIVLEQRRGLGTAGCLRHDAHPHEACTAPLCLPVVLFACGTADPVVPDAGVIDTCCGIDCAAQRRYGLLVNTCFEYSASSAAQDPADLGVLVTRGGDAGERREGAGGRIQRVRSDSHDRLLQLQGRLSAPRPPLRRRGRPRAVPGRRGDCACRGAA